MEQTGHFNCPFNKVGIIKKKTKNPKKALLYEHQIQCNKKKKKKKKKLGRNTSLEKLIKPNKFRKNINAWAQYQK